MALFQKKPQTGTSNPIYTLGLQKNMLIVGLGNIGKEFEGTRHNIGFAVLDAFAEKQSFEGWTNKKDLKCQLVMGNLGETRVILCKPTTMMNLSGEAVQAVSAFYKIELSHLVVVHDELDIEFGQIRTRRGGGSAGHNGIKSISQHMGDDYGHIRVGIGPKKPEQIDSADFVLAKFTSDEQSQMKNLLQEATAILTEVVYAQQLTAETRSFIV
jgi:PTH1 family peptidyl-tRNA hydrolase